MDVQCCVCLSGCDNGGGWSVVLPCGHVFHTLCLRRSLEFKPQCPKCRARVSNVARQVHQVFLDSQGDQDAAGAAEGDALELRTTLFLRERELNKLKEEREEMQTTLKRLREETEQATTKYRAHKQGRINAERKWCAATRESASLKKELQTKLSQLQDAEARAQQLRLAMETSLVGDDLKRELAELTSMGRGAPPYFETMLELRNKQIATSNNRAAELQGKVERLAELCKERQRQLEHALRRVARARGAEAEHDVRTTRAVEPPHAAGEDVIELSASSTENDGELAGVRVVDAVASLRDSGSSLPLAPLQTAGPTAPSRSVRSRGGSFIRKPASATANGLDRDSKYVLHGPDGLGGRATSVARAAPQIRSFAKRPVSSPRMEQFFAKQQRR